VSVRGPSESHKTRFSPALTCCGAERCGVTVALLRRPSSSLKFWIHFGWVSVTRPGSFLSTSMHVFMNSDGRYLVPGSPGDAAPQHSSRIQSIKTESSPSPAPFQFTFRSPPFHSRSRSYSEIPSARSHPWYTPAPNIMSWSTQNPIQNLSNTGVLQDDGTFDLSSVQHNMPFGDDYDDLSELVEMPGAASTFSSLPGTPLSVEKTIRRRSSKGVYL